MVETDLRTELLEHRQDQVVITHGNTACGDHHISLLGRSTDRRPQQPGIIRTTRCLSLDPSFPQGGEQHDVIAAEDLPGKDLIAGDELGARGDHRNARRGPHFHFGDPKSRQGPDRLGRKNIALSENDHPRALLFTLRGNIAALLEPRA